MSDGSDTEREVSGAPGAVAAESAAVGALRERFGDAVGAAVENRGQWRVDLDRGVCLDAIRHLRDDPGLGFEFLVDVTGLDHYGEEPRFRVLWVLRCLKRREELVLKTEVPEEDCWAPSLADDWDCADFLEREVFDMFGIDFRGHPDLRRILLPDVFEDFPLRKDFPMEGTMTDQQWAEWIVARAQREAEGDA